MNENGGRDGNEQVGSMDHTRESGRDDRHLEGDPDARDGIGRLVSAIGAEIEALKQEREASHARTARIRLGAAYAKARLERRAAGGHPG